MEVDVTVLGEMVGAVISDLSVRRGTDGDVVMSDDGGGGGGGGVITKDLAWDDVFSRWDIGVRKFVEEYYGWRGIFHSGIQGFFIL